LGDGFYVGDTQCKTSSDFLKTIQYKFATSDKDDANGITLTITVEGFSCSIPKLRIKNDDKKTFLIYSIVGQSEDGNDNEEERSDESDESQSLAKISSVSSFKLF